MLALWLWTWTALAAPRPVAADDVSPERREALERWHTAVRRGGTVVFFGSKGLAVGGKIKAGMAWIEPTAGVAWRGNLSSQDPWLVLDPFVELLARMPLFARPRWEVSTSGGLRWTGRFGAPFVNGDGPRHDLSVVTGLGFDFRAGRDNSVGLDVQGSWLALQIARTLGGRETTITGEVGVAIVARWTHWFGPESEGRRPGQWKDPGDAALGLTPSAAPDGTAPTAPATTPSEAPPPP